MNRCFWTAEFLYTKQMRGNLMRAWFPVQVSMLPIQEWLPQYHKSRGTYFLLHHYYGTVVINQTISLKRNNQSDANCKFRSKSHCLHRGLNYVPLDVVLYNLHCTIAIGVVAGNYCTQYNILIMSPCYAAFWIIHSINAKSISGPSMTPQTNTTTPNMYKKETLSQYGSYRQYHKYSILENKTSIASQWKKSFNTHIILKTDLWQCY